MGIFLFSKLVFRFLFNYFYFQIIFSVINDIDIKTNYLFTGELEKNLTFWTTVVGQDGRHSAWGKGPVIQPWEEVIQHLEEREYSIKKDFLFNTYQNGTYLIEAKFSWNTSDGERSLLLL